MANDNPIPSAPTPPPEPAKKSVEQRGEVSQASLDGSEVA
jgi:hypothetical protein